MPPRPTAQEVLAKQREIAALEEKLRLRQELPHLFGSPLYSWQREFFECVNREGMFLVAANQIGKSSISIRKVIHWATEKSLWPKLWSRTPTQFAYFYPSASLATIEFKEKWVKEFLPKGSMKDDPVYGWKAIFDTRKKIEAVEFNSGVTLYFKSYEQSQMNLQAHTIFAVFCDEELPSHLYDEIRARLFSVDGYYHMCFTATIGQSLWKDTMEGKGVMERFPNASKWRISMYDCLAYEPASEHIPTPWNRLKIEKIKANCKSENEILRRVYGRFVIDEGLKYHGFLRSRNYKPAHPLPSSWLVYTGIDYGSGGTGGHPSAVCFVKVAPDFRSARVYKTWRGDGIDTTAGDLILKYRELREKDRPVLQSYDHSCKDLLNIASRIGESLVPAEKSHRIGEDLLNTLLRHGMLIIYDDSENHKLVGELESLMNSTSKTTAKDDLVDALRYAISRIPFDFSHLGEEDAARVESEIVKPDPIKDVPDHSGKRRGWYEVRPNEIEEMEFDDTNEDYDSIGYL